MLNSGRNRRSRGVIALAILHSAFGASILAEDRSIDGTGNNLANPTQGAAGTPLIRVAPPAYADGISSPSGADRPDARAISNAVSAQAGSLLNSLGLSSWVFQWGQFVDHDIGLTNSSTGVSFNILVPAGDPVFDPGNTGAATMPFTRSDYDPDTGTSSSNPREQINSITSYLDASVVYGSDQVRADALRTMSGGHLRTSGDNLLPLNTSGLPNATDGMTNPANFYLSGDVRANEQLGLTAIQTLFVREHNRLADEIAGAHPGWSDEQIYQGARKMVGAEIQSITYREFLPALLGASAPGIASVYNPNVNASIVNEFSTALYRVGHTMLPSELLRIANDGTEAPGGAVALRDAFFQPYNIADGQELEYLLKGLATQQQQEIDVHVVDDVRNFLFGDAMPGAGLDLAAMNIERGRDHGLPDYNTVRVAYGLSPVMSFADITSNAALQSALASIYTNVNQIDPWVGALAEDHVPGTGVGSLIQAGLIDQFTRLRDGDRFFFTNADAGLTVDDLAFVSNVRLSDVIERNTGITSLQENVFYVSPVPEPGSLLLLALASPALCIQFFRRRRRTSNHG